MSQDRLPISVIIPVYQSTARLQQHLDSLAALSALVQEFIWVITKSSDASCRTAQKAARKLGGKVLLRPRGLYPAWNAGLARAKGRFVYISTIGDTIRPGGLAALFRTLQATKADVVISPPEVYPATHRNLQALRDWPVFRFAPILLPYAYQIIPKKKALLIQILSGASSILGSCASCLFRKSVFAGNPFPSYYHHYGDTAWIVRRLPGISLAFHPKPVARFWMHFPDEERKVEKIHVYQMIKSLSEPLANPEKRAVEKLVAAKQRLDLIRGEKPASGWWFRPQAWLQRWHRQRQINLLLRSLASETNTKLCA